MMRKHIGLSALFLLFCFNALAQTGSIKGFVYDGSTGEPIMNSTVRVEGTRLGTVTDVNGYFSITQIPVGSYTLLATQISFDTTSESVSISKDQVINKKFYLRRGDVQLKDVVVSSRHTVRTTTANVGLTTITAREIKLLPSAGGEPDIAQFLQITPGVTFTGDQGGQLYIRGGSPTQTGILLDGMTIYNPFHTIGLYSVFETDAIRSVDVQSAGFNAQYGNRTSAILDVHTKDGNKNRLSGKVSASPIMARAMLEGPIIKAKNEGDGTLSFLVNAKYSYLDKTSKNLYSGLGDPFNNGLPYSFRDLYGKVTYNSTSGSKINFFGFNFTDNAQFLQPHTDITTATFKWNATGAGTNFILTPSGSSTLITGKLSYSKYHIDYDEVNATPRSSSISGFEGGIDFTNFLPLYSQLRYGVEVSGLSSALDYSNVSLTAGTAYPTTLDRQNTLASVYVMLRKNFGEKLIIEPGFRMQYYATLNKLSPEPRIQAKYNITPNIRLKAAAGLYSQTLISTKSDRDIVNFFTGFVLTPDQTIYDQNKKELSSNLQTAYHILGGIEVDVKEVEFNIEPWFKSFNKLIELNRNKIGGSPDPVAAADYQAGTGKAYGVDLSFKYSKNRLYLWGAFSYQHVENTFYVSNSILSTANGIQLNGDQQTFPTPYDRRFNMNLLGAYSAGKRREWEFSVRYNLGSPFPFTQTQGFYENQNIANNGVGTNYLPQNGQLGILYADAVNGGRLSWYQRVDASIKRRFRLSKNTNIEATGAVTNVLDRNNIFYVDRISNTRVYQLPLFPSVNMTLNF